MTKHTVIFLALSAIAGSAWAQDPGSSGQARTGNITLGRSNLSISAGALGTIKSISDTFAGSFVFTDFSKLVNFQAPTPTTIGQCIVTPFVPPPDILNIGAFTPLDAGPVMNLTGPNGAKTFPARQFVFGGPLGGGTAIPGLPPPTPLFLDPGSYTVDNGAGGADVGPFTATITVPGDFAWTNADAPEVQSIDRTAGVDVAWMGGDPNSKVTISGGVLVLDPGTLKISAGAFFACTENNNAGHFFVSPDVLSLVPASAMNGASNGALTVSDGVQTTFSATGIDTGSLNFSAVTVRNVAYF